MKQSNKKNNNKSGVFGNEKDENKQNENGQNENEQNINEQDENKQDENKQDENKQDENKQDENKQDKNDQHEKEQNEKENYEYEYNYENELYESQNKNNINQSKKITTKNDIVYPKGLKNFLYEKKYYSQWNYNNKEMTTGNICYMNSSIQCLFHLKDFTDNITNTAVYNKGDLIRATSNLIEEMKSFNKKNSDILSAKYIKKVMGEIDQRYKDNSQEDANEFISNFLDGLLNEIGDKNNLPKPLDIKNESDKVAYNKFYKRFYTNKGNSFLLDLFYSILKTQKVCKSCGKVNSIKFNAFNIIELPIKNLANKENDIQLVDIIENYFKKNGNIDGECKFCGKNNIYEKINIYLLPKYLILYFGRTIDNYYINNRIIYPYQYTFESFFNKDNDYTLECVIEHSGGAHYGHYTSLCPINKTNKWYKFSDTSFYEHHNFYHGENAIILLYKKKTN